jgi:hypothetical protein
MTDEAERQKEGRVSRLKDMRLRKEEVFEKGHNEEIKSARNRGQER